MTRYDMFLSHKRLMEQGFHPAVTSKTPLQLEKDYFVEVERLIGYRKAQDPARYLTTAMLLTRYDRRRKTESKDNLLADILSTIDVGGEVAVHLFIDGRASVLNAALTARTSWRAIANNVKIWDFNASDMRIDGQSGVFLIVNPECTVGELSIADALDPYGLDPGNHMSQWCGEAMRLEREIYFSIYLVHGQVQAGKKNRKTNRRRGNNRREQPNRSALPIAFLREEILEAIGSIKNIKAIWSCSQFLCSPPSRLFEPPNVFALDRLNHLLRNIYEQKTALKVLYLERVPYLDRRLVAVILRACPNVRMVGIYDCPLIHFGDVLCFIDLIHEINRKRRAAKNPQIMGFDFFPRYHYGGPKTSEHSATYGLTWGPQTHDVAQRGFYNIMMKAFFKARRMKLGLLFDKGKAFRQYLSKVPNDPLAVPTFLDALYRLMEARTDEQRRPIMYDLLKPVRLGLDMPLNANLNNDWPRYYNDIMGRHLVFCASCGYETVQEFYSLPARAQPPPHRNCTGCSYRSWLDREEDHLKQHKKAILNTLFPDWNPDDHNEDAPLAQQAKALIKLRSTIAVKSNSTHYIDDQGDWRQRPTENTHTRHRKVHEDSLQNLPSLHDLLHGKGHVRRWGDVYNKCNNLDMYCRALRCIRAESPRHPLVTKQFHGGMPDHVEELQPPQAVVSVKCSYDLELAWDFYQDLVAWGLAAHEMDEATAKARRQRKFW